MLKEHFLQFMCDKKRHIKLSHLDIRIDDLWHSLLKENFVFSFKNTLEIIAYKTLETEWSRNWQLPFYEDMLNWEKTAEYWITTADTMRSISEAAKSRREELKKLWLQLNLESRKKWRIFLPRNKMRM